MDDGPRTRAQQQARTRERLLDAAQELFAERGLRGASLAEIARRAGFTKGAVYANFADKEELFLAVLDRHLASRVDDRGRDPSSGPGNAVDQFDRAWGLLALEAVLYAVREAPALREQIARRYRDIDASNSRDGAEVRDVDSAVAWNALGEGLMLRHLVDPQHVDHARVERVFAELFRPDPTTS